MSKLVFNVRTRETYFDSIKKQQPATQKNKRYAVQDFDKFCAERHHIKNCEPIIDEILQKPDSDTLRYDLLQEWINWSNKRPNSLKVYFASLNDYLYYRGIKISKQDVKHNLKFPKVIKHEYYPLTLEEIQRIITPVNHDKKRMYLSLISSGMRIGEALQIKRKHLDLTTERIKVSIPGEMTKTGAPRITFLSKEAAKYNISNIKKLDENDLVWGQNPDVRNNVITEAQNFARYCDKVGLGMKYPSGVRKITIHSFRSYFITKGNSVDFGFGHALAGHDYYMKRYDRYTQDQLLEKYLEFEPDLLVFDLTRKDEEIKKHKDALRVVDDLKQKLEEETKKRESSDKILERLLSQLPKAQSDNQTN